MKKREKIRKKKFIPSIKIQEQKKTKHKISVIRAFMLKQKVRIKTLVNKLKKAPHKYPKLVKSSKGHRLSSMVRSLFQKKKVPIQEKMVDEKKKLPTLEGNGLSLNETKIDLLYKMIQEKGQITWEEASRKLNINKEIVMTWAKILEEHELIAIKYPTFGQPIFKKRETK